MRKSTLKAVVISPFHIKPAHEESKRLPSLRGWLLLSSDSLQRPWEMWNPPLAFDDSAVFSGFGTPTVILE